MTPFHTLASAAIAGLVLAACSAEEAPQISPQHREALTEDMLEPDSFSSGFIPGPGGMTP